MNSITRNTFLLHQRLGDWVRPPLWEQRWRYNNTMKSLYGGSSKNIWKVYRPLHTRTQGNRRRFRVQSESQELPRERTLWPASDTLLRNGDVIFTGAARCHLVETDKPSLQDLLNDDDANWMWKEKALETEPAVLARGLQMGKVTLIADGSWYRDLDPTKGGRMLDFRDRRKQSVPSNGLSAIDW